MCSGCSRDANAMCHQASGDCLTAQGLEMTYDSVGVVFVDCALLEQVVHARWLSAFRDLSFSVTLEE